MADRVVDHLLIGGGIASAQCAAELRRRGAGYVVLWNAFKKIAAEFDPAEQDALFRGTASTVYRL